MNHQTISFSGGRTSAYMVLKVLDLHPDAEVIYCDTGAEHPGTYRFMREFSEEYGIDITCLRAVPPPGTSRVGAGRWGFEVLSVYDIGPDFVPMLRLARYLDGRPMLGCNRCKGDRLKERCYNNYCNAIYGRGKYVRWVGIRADESKRAKTRKNIRYLCDIDQATKPEILEFWKRQPIDLDIPPNCGNCMFCPKKSNGIIRKAAAEEPEYLEQWLKLLPEQQIFYHGGLTLTEVLNEGKM
ncbi:phosphoadenosine phosphosulfate reductase family protein [Escherichia coli]|nr:phosphoadenosine phosphosulfate reductase family protein [Escherichia coli]MEE1486497.1 phosphoadenosine phosphosulfate reductase family protein [Shigella flexneri]